MKMKNLIKSRRGVAMEMAVGVMFVMMAFTIMLLSTAGLQNRHRNDDYKKFNEMIEVNNIGELALERIINDASVVFPFNIIENGVEYTVKETIDDKEYKIYRGTDEEELILTITLSNDGKTITSWK